MRKYVSSLLIVIYAFNLSIAQTGEQPFIPIPEAEKRLYRFDFGRWFYANEQARQSDVDELRRLTEQITTLKPLVRSAPERLLQAIQLKQSMGIIANHLNAYGGLRFSVNTSDTVARDEGEHLSDEVEASTAFVKTAVQEMGEEELKAFESQPGAAPFSFLVRKWRRDRPHTGTEQQEALLAQLSSRLDPFGEAFYALLTERTPDSTLSYKGRSYNVVNPGDYAEIMRFDEREVRETSFRKRLAAFKSQSDIYAYSLFQKIKAANSVADVHKFPTAIEESLFKYYLSPETVDAVLKAFKDHSDLTIRFQKAERVYQQKMLGLTQARPWDLEVRPPGAPEPRFTISEASRAVAESTLVLGQDYQNELRSLLDPRNGRLDIVAGNNRESGDFTWGFYGPSWVFYMNGYKGFLTDVVTLAHESAHAVHWSLLYKANVPWYYADGARYFTEGFAKVNELLVLDYLSKKAKNEEERLYYLRELNSKLASVKFASMFWAAYATGFEVEAYRRVKDGRIKKPEEIHEIWAEFGRRFLLDHDEYPDLKYSWVGTHHFFDAPRYYSNYLFAWILAVTLYERFQNDPTAIDQYVRLMKAGFSDEPPVLLKNYLGIDLSNPSTLERAFAVVERNLVEFESRVNR